MKRLISNIPLKSCPFCGGRAEMLPQESKYFKKKCFLVTCLSCRASKLSHTSYKKQAAAEWNNRQPPKEWFDEVELPLLKRPKRKANPINVRRLAENLKQTGTLQMPLRVQQLPRGRYIIIDGLDRFEAMISLGWKYVRVSVVPWDGEQ